MIINHIISSSYDWDWWLDIVALNHGLAGSEEPSMALVWQLSLDLLLPDGFMAIWLWNPLSGELSWIIMVFGDFYLIDLEMVPWAGSADLGRDLWDGGRFWEIWLDHSLSYDLSWIVMNFNWFLEQVCLGSKLHLRAYWGQILVLGYLIICLCAGTYCHLWYWS